MDGTGINRSTFEEGGHLVCLRREQKVIVKKNQGVDSMPENIASQQQSAKHLAARAVMAYRAGFPIALLSVTCSSECPSGIVCDWKGQRDSFHNDVKLLGRAFAFVYIGSIRY